MKQLLFIAACCAATFLTSCKKDKSPEELLTGKWNVTKLLADGDDIIQGTGDYKSAVEIEFTEAGSVVFTVTEKDLTVSPAEESTYTVAGTYSWSGDDQLTMVVTDIDTGETLTGTGTANVTANHLKFTAANGSNPEFIEYLEADKL